MFCSTLASKVLAVVGDEIHRDEKGEQFAKEYEKAIKELKEDGTLAKLSQQYFKEDVFSYVDKD